MECVRADGIRYSRILPQQVEIRGKPERISDESRENPVEAERIARKLDRRTIGRNLGRAARLDCVADRRRDRAVRPAEQYLLFCVAAEPRERARSRSESALIRQARESGICILPDAADPGAKRAPRIRFSSNQIRTLASFTVRVATWVNLLLLCESLRLRDFA